MPLEIQVLSYSGWAPDERPREFIVDEDCFRVIAVEDQWRTPEGTFFKVRTPGKQFILRHDESNDKWTLENELDGPELYASPSIEIITVDAKTIHEKRWLRAANGVERRL